MLPSLSEPINSSLCGCLALSGALGSRPNFVDVWAGRRAVCHAGVAAAGLRAEGANRSDVVGDAQVHPNQQHQLPRRDEVTPDQAPGMRHLRGQHPVALVPIAPGARRREVVKHLRDLCRCVVQKAAKECHRLFQVLAEVWATPQVLEEACNVELADTGVSRDSGRHRWDHENRAAGPSHLGHSKEAIAVRVHIASQRRVCAAVGGCGRLSL
eukprot:CAMPEP_0171129632 /NCGR_PEP_ID=MMETSP0766_2-20121228/119362_1 /TAXON_ID=439317 /ORGANISM="Gambierdiscus australes, Strain CAWD 149" /LENGTH=211 /DNA_ID=CAMNT_0011592841 /DNA_START=77 /DNA_END=709 /DNA_ORIENTATION=+